MTTTAPTTTGFSSLSDFLRRAEPGDLLTDEASARSQSTYRFLERRDNESDGQGGIIETITTTHHGKAEYVGPPAYQY